MHGRRLHPLFASGQIRENLKDRICCQSTHHTSSNSSNVEGFQETPGLTCEVSEVHMVGLTIGPLPTVELPEVTFASIQFGTEVNCEFIGRASSM